MEILDSTHELPGRPISQLELKDMDIELKKKFKFSGNEVYHTKCNHFYFIKKYGKKDNILMERISECDMCNKKEDNDASNTPFGENNELLNTPSETGDNCDRNDDKDDDQECDRQHNYNIGYCSVCWKLRNTPDDYYTIASDVVDKYMYIFSSKRKLTHYNLSLENVFYTWLYHTNKKQ
jgi:hypothetical protein